MSNKEEALCSACRKDDPAAVRRIIAAGGVNVNAPDSRGWTAAIYAAEAHTNHSGSAECIELLRNAGAYLSVASRGGWTPAHCAAYRGNTAVLRILVGAGAELEQRSSAGRTPAHHAAFRGKTEALAILLDAGVDVSVRNNYGDTPLDDARIHGKEDCVRLLGACLCCVLCVVLVCLGL